LSIIRDGKITWHLSDNPPLELGDWSEVIYIGRPSPPAGMVNRWPDGSMARAPKPAEMKPIKELAPWDPTSILVRLQPETSRSVKAKPSQVEPKRAPIAVIAAESSVSITDSYLHPDDWSTETDDDVKGAVR